MRPTPLTRRGALVALVGLGAGALENCNAPETTAVRSRSDAPKPKIAAIAVDASALDATSGETTALWVQSSLPGRLAQAFAADMAPGDPDGATLNVQITSVVLGMVSPAGAIELDQRRGDARRGTGDREVGHARRDDKLPRNADRPDPVRAGAQGKDRRARAGLRRLAAAQAGVVTRFRVNAPTRRGA